MYTVYVVEDAPIVQEIASNIARVNSRFSIAGSAATPKQALTEIFALRPDVVFGNLSAKGAGGMELMEALNEQGYAGACVMLGAHSTFEDCRHFFRQGGFDYLLKPLAAKELAPLLERLAKQLFSNPPAWKGAEPEPIAANRAFLELLRYLNANYCQKHTLESLSKKFNLNSNYICRLFSRHLGTTLIHYLTALRMKAALKAMRSSGHMAYKEIAIKCGYNDYCYFCRVFKEYYGAPPGAYLKELENGKPAKSVQQQYSRVPK